MATNYDRRRRQEQYDDIDAYARRAVDAEIADRDRRPAPRRTRIDLMTALAWIVLLTLAAGVALILAINSGLLPESLLGKFARQVAPEVQPTIVTRPITGARQGFTSDTRTAPASNVASDVAAPVPANPDAAGDVVLSNPEAVGADAAPAQHVEQPTPSEADSGMGGGSGMACDSSWSNCQAVDIVPLAEPRAEIAAPESDAGWGMGGGSGVQPQPTPDSEHSGSYGSGGGGGQACDASWSNCTEVTP